MAMPSMSPVIRRCLSGDQQAQEELVLAAQNRVYYHCRKMLKHEEDALDATQEILISMLTRLDRLQDPEAFWGWLSAMTANHCRNVLTRGRREAQIPELDATWAGMGAVILLAVGFVKVVVTAMCVNMGWRGGHFFPIIFAGISIGYGMSVLTGVDPVFSLCVVTAALVGGVMRKPVMAVLLLFLCFPVLAAVPMLVAAFLGSRVPLPAWVSAAEDRKEGSDAGS